MDYLPNLVFAIGLFVALIASVIINIVDHRQSKNEEKGPWDVYR